MSVLKRLENTLEELKRDPRTARITVRMETWIHQALAEIGARHGMTATEVAYAALRAVAEEAVGAPPKAGRPAKRKEGSTPDGDTGAPPLFTQ